MPSIAIYPYNDKQSATAFLLSLHAKGYHPRVVVTDLRVDYGPLVAQVFPKATHHECIFHALRQAHRHLRAVYRAAEERAHPDIDALREAVDALWDTPSKRTAQRRYDNLNRFLVTGGKRQIGCAGLAYSVDLRYDLLPLPGWDSTWMIRAWPVAAMASSVRGRSAVCHKEGTEPRQRDAHHRQCVHQRRRERPAPGLRRVAISSILEPNCGIVDDRRDEHESFVGS